MMQRTELKPQQLRLNFQYLHSQRVFFFLAYNRLRERCIHMYSKQTNPHNTWSYPNKKSFACSFISPFHPPNLPLSLFATEWFIGNWLSCSDTQIIPTHCVRVDMRAGVGVRVITMLEKSFRWISVSKQYRNWILANTFWIGNYELNWTQYGSVLPRGKWAKGYTQKCWKFQIKS